MRGRKLTDTGADGALLHSIMADRLYLFYGFTCRRQYISNFCDGCVLVQDLLVLQLVVPGYVYY